MGARKATALRTNLSVRSRGGGPLLTRTTTIAGRLLRQLDQRTSGLHTRATMSRWQTFFSVLMFAVKVVAADDDDDDPWVLISLQLVLGLLQPLLCGAHCSNFNPAAYHTTQYSNTNQILRARCQFKSCSLASSSLSHASSSSTFASPPNTIGPSHP